MHFVTLLTMWKHGNYPIFILPLFSFFLPLLKKTWNGSSARLSVWKLAFCPAFFSVCKSLVPSLSLSLRKDEFLSQPLCWVFLSSSCRQITLFRFPPFFVKRKVHPLSLPSLSLCSLSGNEDRLTLRSDLSLDQLSAGNDRDLERDASSQRGIMLRPPLEKKPFKI